VKGKNDPWDGCSLDYAEQGPLSLQAVADLMGCTDNAIHDTERRALRKLAIAARRLRGESWETPGHWSDTEEGA